MLEGYKTKMKIGIGIWVIFILAQVILKKTGHGDSGLSTLAWIGAMVTMVCSCYFSAKGKGHTGVWALLGVFSIIGLIILMFFPDKNK